MKGGTMVLTFVSAISIFLILYICRLFYRKAIRKEELNRREIYKFIFKLYLAAIAAITVFPVEIPPMKVYGDGFDFVNVIPFYYLCEPFGMGAIRNIVGNICMFIPFYTLYSIAGYEKLNTIRKFLTGILIISLSIEMVQFVENSIGFSSYFPRMADIDDIILNVLGAATGWFLYRGHKRLSA